MTAAPCPNCEFWRVERDKAVAHAMEYGPKLAESDLALARVWKALGIENYEQAGGKEISEIVAERCAPRTIIPLQWICKHGSDSRWRADTSIGTYDVDPWWPRPAPADELWAGTGPLSVLGMEFDTPEAAKAAAQTDYEKRILTAFSAIGI